MRYYYDIILNFSEDNYDFYEWKEKDNLEEFSKIPIIKISNKIMTDLINNNVIVNQSFLQSIEDKTFLKTKSIIKTIRYSCIFTDEISTIALEFDNNGKSIKRSNLMLDDDLDITGNSYKIQNVDLEYKLINKVKFYNETRKIRDLKDKILMEVNGDINKDKLIYLYLEIFKKVEKNLNKIINDINKNIDKFSLDLLIDISNIIDLSQQNV